MATTAMVILITHMFTEWDDPASVEPPTMGQTLSENQHSKQFSFHVSISDVSRHI